MYNANAVSNLEERGRGGRGGGAVDTHVYSIDALRTRSDSHVSESQNNNNNINGKTGNIFTPDNVRRHLKSNTTTAKTQSISEKLRSLQYINDNISNAIGSNHNTNNNTRHDKKLVHSPGGTTTTTTTTHSSSSSKLIQNKVNTGLYNLDELLRDLFHVSDKV